MDKTAEEIGVIRDSGLFDEIYYRNTYAQDGQEVGDDLEDFVARGCEAGKRPNFYFDPRWYLENNRDVGEIGLQPLYHYAKFGDLEGRRACAYFDPTWYRRHYQLPPKTNALAHYLAHRRSYRYSPVPGFDPAFYAAAYPEIASEGLDPFEDYLAAGYREGRNPSASFDTHRYQDRYLGGDRAQNPLLHYLINREALECLRRSGLFDYDYYRANNAAITDTGIDLLAHFFYVGFKEGTRPNLYFDPLWYLEQNPDVAEENLQPLFHYAQFGDREGRRPCVYFDPIWYRRRYELSHDTCTLAHYLAHRHSCRYSPVPEFDAVFYGETYPDIAAAGLDPFEHYLFVGYREGRDPSAAFNSESYRDHYRRIEREANPLIRYLALRDVPGIAASGAAERVTIADEVRKYAASGEYFEEFAPPEIVEPRAKVLAYYLSQFHPCPENDAWWGTGFTEWTNIARGVPRFRGHHQPRIPRDLGFYTLDNTETIRRQVEMAKRSGIFGFVVYFYWFNGRRLLDAPVERFLADKSLDMPFCLMWANENWTRRWDGGESEILISQDYRASDDEALAAEFHRHFADPRYIRIDRRPVLMIYRPGLIPDARATVTRWREIFRRRFDEAPILVMAQSFSDLDPEQYGLDGAIEFPPHKLAKNLPTINHEIEYLDPKFTGAVFRYDDIVRASLEAEPPPYPLIKTLVPSWDNDARRQGNGVVIAGSTPIKYQHWLGALVARARATPFFGENFVCVNAWNEWCEGAYLEPDVHFGGAYLNATARAITALSAADQVRRLLLVGDDAEPREAALNLLNIGRHLRRSAAVDCEFVLLAGGELEAEFKAAAPTRIVAAGPALEGLLRALRERGFTQALISGRAAVELGGALHGLGIAATVLVDEPPAPNESAARLTAVRAALRTARDIVFPATIVRDRALAALAAESDERCAILPPGNYRDVVASPEAAAALREEHAIDQADRLVLGAGPADLRKGFDLFVQLWRLLGQRRGRRTHLCWVGAIDPILADSFATEIAEASAAGTFHVVGEHTDISAFLAAADAFALTSRDDPYPAIVLEALSAGLPVFAFDRAGGIPELLSEHGVGTVVPYCDVIAMARAIETSLRKGPDPEARERRRELIRTRFDFDAYVEKLLALAFPDTADPAADTAKIRHLA